MVDKPVSRFEFDQVVGMVQGDHARLRELEKAYEGIAHDLPHIVQSQKRLEEGLLSHMEKEDKSFSNIYNLIRSMDKETGASFKERDGKIATIDKSQAKMLGWAFGAFTAINLAITIAFHVWGG